MEACRHVLRIGGVGQAGHAREASKVGANSGLTWIVFSSLPPAGLGQCGQQLGQCMQNNQNYCDCRGPYDGCLQSIGCSAAVVNAAVQACEESGCSAAQVCASCIACGVCACRGWGLLRYVNHQPRSVVNLVMCSCPCPQCAPSLSQDQCNAYGVFVLGAAVSLSPA